MIIYDKNDIVFLFPCTLRLFIYHSRQFCFILLFDVLSYFYQGELLAREVDRQKISFRKENLP